MDHIVYLDYREKELSRLIDGTKSMIVRGAAGRKMPYDRVVTGDHLYFIENDGSGKVKSEAIVSSVFNSEKMSKDESEKMIQDNQEKLMLTKKQIKRWAGKRYLVLIELSEFQMIEPFEIDRSDYGNMDDWLLVQVIERVKK
jgi:hypothetical protein